MSCIMSLGLNDQWQSGLIEPLHKSAGLAFAMSLLVPGAGQVYCGKTTRGAVTLAFTIVGLLLCFNRSPQIEGLGVTLVLVLWIFSFLDAYFTATEINLGEDSQVDVQNPRVAVTLNLLTAGFGYFYLGERTKGLVIFLGAQAMRVTVTRLGGHASRLIALVLVLFQVLMAADAYRIAHAQIKEALGPKPEDGLAPKTSRLPAFVPIGLACLVGAGCILLWAIGMAFMFARSR
jgi:hypothetical protein